MDIQEKSQSSREENKEDADDDIIGRMEIDDASDMNEVAGILLHLNVSSLAPHDRTRYKITYPQCPGRHIAQESTY